MGYRFADYLRDRAPSAAVACAGLAVVALMLMAAGVAGEGVAAACGVAAAAGALATGLDYLRRRRYYRRLAALAEGLAREGRAYLAAELAEEPACAEERVFQEALRLGSKSMADELARMRADQRAYRDYVETWVHEVKTPIAAARLAAANDPCPVAEAMDVELGRVEGFVDQALYYARSTSLDRDFQVREVVLADVARAAVRSCARTLIDAGVAPELTDLDLTVRADPKWLEFCLRQVLVNAAKYRRDADALAGEPARVRLWARRRQTGLDAWETELFVEDNGVGIPACDLARVWDRGFTGENGRRYARSTGIGLYLVRELCAKMGLGVSCDSEPGAWTRVSVTFPDSAC